MADTTDADTRARYRVLKGVRGAIGVKRTPYIDLLDAERDAERWGNSNGQGSYWARVVDMTTGETIRRIN